MYLETEGDHYHVLADAATAIKGVPGAVCEIGTRKGGSLGVIVNALEASGDHGRNVICVDPWGNIDYIHLNDQVETGKGYSNEMRNEAIPNIFNFIKTKPVNLQVFCLEDTEFFKRFADGVPFYNRAKVIETQYALVYFDGPHGDAQVMAEMDFFLPRSVPGTHFVFDDTSWYNHKIVHERMLAEDWDFIIDSGFKASYRKP